MGIGHGRRGRALVGVLGAAGLAAALLPAFAGAAPAPAAPRGPAVPVTGNDGPPVVLPAVSHDTSRPLREMPPQTLTMSPHDQPQSPPMPPERLAAAKAKLTAGTARPQTEPAAPALAAPLPAMPATTANFDGVANVNGYYPPDTNGDVGPNHYVEMVNSSMAVFDKAGNTLWGPVNNSTIWGGFGGECQLSNDGDPIVQYDQLADRWLVTQFAVSSGDMYECVAVSATPDPLGAYHRYAFGYGTAMPDYPKFGVWPDGYYVTYNSFDGAKPAVPPRPTPGAGPVTEPNPAVAPDAATDPMASGDFLGSTVCAMERRAMLVGAPATQQCFTLKEEWSQLPSDLDGPVPPPEGSPNYIVSAHWDDIDKLTMYKFSVDWDDPNSTLLAGPLQINVAPKHWACAEVYRGRCVPQKDTAVKLESLGSRTMYRLAYRNHSGHESLVTNQTVALEDTFGQPTATGVQWYEIRDPETGAPTLHQQGTVASSTPGEFRFMASIAQDREGNIGLGYSSSSAAMHPSINYLGRLVTDPLGTMPYEQGTIITGGGSQTGSSARWGDYTSMNVDPVDDCTFWHANEYLPVTAQRAWHTRVAAFRFPSCDGPNATVPSSPGAAAVTAGLASATVSWSPPVTDNGSPVNSYVVTASPGGATCTTVVGATRDPDTCTVEGLADGTTYTFGVIARNAIGDSPATAAGAATPGPALVPVTPQRIADTRPGEQVAFPPTKAPLVPGTPLEVPVGGAFGVPANAAGAALNVTAVRGAVNGYLTVYPCGSPPATPASNVNYTAGQVVASAVVSGLGTGGKVCVASSSQVEVVVDLNGWLPTGSAFHPAGPVRLVDTRAGSTAPQPPLKGKLPAGSTIEIAIAGDNGVPDGAAAATLTVTATGGTANGFFTVFPCDEARPNSSNLNYRLGQTVPNLVVAGLGISGNGAGRACLYTSASADVVVDLTGWFAKSPAFTRTDPVRLADTRPGQPVAIPAEKAKVPAGGVLTIPVWGLFGVPAGSGAYSLNVTATGADARGYLTVYPCGASLPPTSSVNYSPGQVTPNAVLVGADAQGRVCVRSTAATDVVVDLDGWFPASARAN